MYILDLSMTLTFYIYVGGGGILSEFYSQFLSSFDANVYNHDSIYIYNFHE